MDSPSATSAADYRHQNHFQQQFCNVPSSSNISGRRAIASSYDHVLPLFSSSEGYSLPFQMPHLDSAPPQYSLLQYQQIDNPLIQPSSSLPPSLTMTPSVTYGAVTEHSANPSNHLKPIASSSRRLGLGPPSQGQTYGPQPQGSGKTDVDTLMKAIQRKDTDQQSAVPSLSLLASNSSASDNVVSTTDSRQSSSSQGSRVRKKYQCHVPSCAKRFFQKTHLEIHMRAHTGYKPFVSPPNQAADEKTENRSCAENPAVVSVSLSSGI